MDSEERGSKTAATGVALLGHLIVAVISGLAGVVLGGWLAFQTGRWVAFKAWIEGLGGATPSVVVGLFVLAAAVGIVASVRGGNA